MTNAQLQARIAIERSEVIITKAKYEAIHPDYRGVWTTERTDLGGWDLIRSQYMGKRTLMVEGALIVEGMGLTIVEGA